MRRVLIATGGTGGHLFPAQKAADELTDCEILFAGHNLKKSPFFDQKRASVEIVSSNRNPFTLLKGLWQSFKLMVRFKPDVVLGFGSFHSLPVLVAAVLLRKKIVLFEANCSFGKVTQALLPFADKVALQFPVRQGDKFPCVALRAVQKQVTQEEARRFYGLKPDLFTILVFGGSQGAQFINERFFEAAKLLPFPFQVIHLTGKPVELAYSLPSCVKPFETKMHYAYAASDMAVCRSGAGTTAELIEHKLPAVFIPYPHAYDHQKHNAFFMQDGARILLQHEATSEKLAAEIVSLSDNLAFARKAIEKLQVVERVPFSKVIG